METSYRNNIKNTHVYRRYLSFWKSLAEGLREEMKAKEKAGLPSADLYLHHPT
jgi:hypothetical protein